MVTSCEEMLLVGYISSSVLRAMLDQLIGRSMPLRACALRPVQPPTRRPPTGTRALLIMAAACSHAHHTAPLRSGRTSGSTRCNFIPGSGAAKMTGVDVTPWMDQAPIHVSA